MTRLGTRRENAGLSLPAGQVARSSTETVTHDEVRPPGSWGIRPPGGS